MITNNLSNTENEFPQGVIYELVGIYTEAGHVDLAQAATVVEQNSGSLFSLKTPKGYSVRVCGQDGTVYDGNEEELEAWKDFYLPKRMEMVVIGAVDEFPCEAFDEQLVLLLCEDGKVYAYEDEVLHLVATSLNELFETGMNFPGLETYKLGECFEDCTEEEYNEIMKSEDMIKMKEAHNQYRDSLEIKLPESLKENKSQNKAEELIQYKKNSHTVKKECWELVHYIDPYRNVINHTHTEQYYYRNVNGHLVINNKNVKIPLITIN